MAKALIKFAFRQVITTDAISEFEQSIFNTTYREFKDKALMYNQEGKFDTFSQMKAHDLRANTIHHKMSFVALNLLLSLDNKIPGFTSNLGKSILFETPKFELIESSLSNKAAHKVAINYCTGLYTLYGIAGEFLVLAEGDTRNVDGAATITVKMTSEVSVIYFKEENISHSGNYGASDALATYTVRGNLLA